MDHNNNNHGAVIRFHHHHPYNGHGGREDCWSEAASAVLIQAWGDRYLQLNRGNLRQKDWKEVADTVNARQDVVKIRKTDVQCKNRIDTIKKKYKLEKSKPPPSKWPFFSHLDQLIGSNIPLSNKKLVNPTPLPHKSPQLTFTVKNPNPNPNTGMYSSRMNNSHNSHNLHGSSGSGSSRGGDDDDDEEEEEEEVEEDVRGVENGRRKERTGAREDVEDVSDRAAFRELASAIHKFGEVYERIESSKQQHMMELERQRMEFTKDLEFQRMQMFMEAQLELEKMKRPKYASNAGKK